MMNKMMFMKPLMYVYSIYTRLKQRLDFHKRHVYIAKGTYLAPDVKVGYCTRINNPSYITSCTIGAYCAIGGRLVVRSTNHTTDYINIQSWAQKNIINSDVGIAGYSKGDVSIGNGVWIGDSVIILSGVTVGNGAVIGAGSVVTKSIPDYSIAVGNPARVVGARYDKEVLDRICQIKWWEWDSRKIERNKIFFETNLKNIKPDDLDELIAGLEL